METIAPRSIVLLTQKAEIERLFLSSTRGRQDMIDIQLHFRRTPLANIAALVGMDRDHQVILKLKWPSPMSTKCQIDAFPNVAYIILCKFAAQPLVCESPKVHQSIGASLPLSELISGRRYPVYSLLAHSPVNLFVEQ
jgi:hypothetical protein